MEIKSLHKSNGEGNLCMRAHDKDEDGLENSDKMNTILVLFNFPCK